MNVVYIITDSYVPFLGISLISLFENTTDLSLLNLFILSDDLSEQHQVELSDLSAKYGRTITFINVSGYKDAFNFQFNTSGFCSIVLARLLLPRYLPDNISTVLYLDSDIIINGSIKELESVSNSINHYAFAAVPELYMPSRQKQMLNLSASDIYYNCGMLFINLDYWRNKSLSDRFIKYYLEMNGQLLYNDQDILNHCCKDEIFTLSHTYNFPPALYYFPRYFIRRYQPAFYCNNKKTYCSILNNPAIIHYSGEERPWYHGNFSPYKKNFEHYRNLSPWKNLTLTYGKERLLFCYHILNCITRICPYFRKFFTQSIGIYYYKRNKK